MRILVLSLMISYLWVGTAQADSYVLTQNAAISGHNKKKVSGGVEACKQACSAERSFSCKSFDYDKRNQSCDLSDKSASDVGGLKTNYSGNPYDHYARKVASASARMQDRSAPMRAEFKCGKQVDDGCSNPLSDPSAKTWKRIFEPACQVHDWCYRAPWRISGTTGYKGQKQCDDEFEANMTAICSKRSGIEQVDCWTQKTAFHLTVRDWGHKAFDNGQKVAEAKCETAKRVNNGAITFFNSGGYVAKFVLTYLKADKIEGIEILLPVIESKSVPIGKYVEWEIPAGSKAINVAAYSKTGLVWEPERLIVSESWGDKPRNKCIKVYGTTLNPKHNNVCDLFDR